MSKQQQTKIQATTAPNITPKCTRLLQRKCACGGSPGVDGECAECRNKRLASSRSLIDIPNIQTKLTVNQPGDRYEQEADQMAEQVMRMPELTFSRSEELQGQSLKVEEKDKETTQIKKLHRKPIEHDEEEEEILQAKEAPGHAPNVTPKLQSRINSIRGGGQLLPEPTRTFFEKRLGHDFSQVRIHTDSYAGETARAVNAQAFTLGHDIVFGAGRYAPETTAGKSLLAHELTHVVQQQRASSLIQRKDNDQEKSSVASSWTAIVHNTKAALAHHDMKTAEKLYRDAIVTAAANAIFPAGITKLEPKPEDIRLDFNLSAGIRSRSELSAFAETRPDEIPKNETNYWHWIYFGPETLMESQAHTESVISHELIHVRQYQKLWNDYKANKSPDKGTWKDFRKPFDLSARAEGPDELEAEITSLAFLGRLNPKEQELALRGLLVAYINTSVYIPPKGEIPAITTIVALPQILDAFKRADPSLQGRMGEAVWWALMKVNPSKDRWQSVLRELKPLAIKGYSDPTFKQIYDRFLGLTGLTFREIVGGP